MTKTNNIAFQGVLGAYSHMACQAHRPDLTPLPCASFSEMIAAVQDGGADCAMVPVENSTAGRVADIHHLLPESGLFIISEHYQPVAHKLLGIKGAQLSDITEVHSHEQGLAQCRLTLHKMGIKPVIHSDTAGAAKDIAARGERHVGAIASALAGEIYGLDTVQDSITDKLTNTTRFLVMSREHTVPKEITAPAMTTIIFEVRSVPAVLYKALGGFATNGINLTKLESYMLDGSMNAARFYVDCEGHPETASMKLALEELQFYCTDGGIRILGTYPTNR
ncbi:MAG: prephenate dehydratase [Alphaproteobacteria bacterium]|jgi:prephenate dehydratase|nr:prephenate dehydratase [Alphaproteobacteria bacterium]MBT5256418.1 prephenate dehydratase [Alphaproteobacteria bacterium]MBT5481147.1 prephenate dehydratase [Alphaproteobacteria bacterium]MBT5728855.1 prephenate dehydratase [Alphaproteobacteria bacterium]MBT7220954.1 prephenate dehydratase [Alphaproteobacteria bacterium]